MAIYIRPFKKEDFEMFIPIEPLEGSIKTELVQAIEDSGLAVSGIKDGKVIASAGVHPANSEQGELWLRVSKGCSKYPVEVYRFLKRGLKIIEETYPFRQLYAVVNVNFERGIRLIERFGYKPVEYRTVNKNRYIVYTKLVKE